MLYFLRAFSLTILGVSETPEFEVSSAGFYRIHSLVYNPETLDLSVVVPGSTTGFDVLNIINENNICASLDVHGAINLVLRNRWFCYFFDYYHRGNDVDSVNDFVKGYDSYEAFKTDFILENSEIKLYPNPAINEITLDVVLFDDEIMNYTIYDISGRQITSGSVDGNNSEMINVNALQSGIYLINLQSDYRSMKKKIQIRK